MVPATPSGTKSKLGHMNLLFRGFIYQCLTKFQPEQFVLSEFNLSKPRRLAQVKLADQVYMMSSAGDVFMSERFTAK